MAILRLDGDSSGAEKAIERTSDALSALDRKAKASKIVPDSAGVKRLEGDVRSLEAAGRILGGRMGELTGVLGDFSDVASAGISPLGLVAGAIAAIGVAAVGTVAGMVSLTRSAIDVATETNRMNADLTQAQSAMNAVTYAADGLTVELGTRTAGAVTSMSYALLGLVEATSDAAEAVSDNTPEGLGTVLTAQYALTYPKTAAAVYALAKAYEYLEEKGQDAARAQPVKLPKAGALGMESAEAMALRIRQQAAQIEARDAEKASEERKRQREKDLRDEIEQRTREAQAFVLGAEQQRQVWSELYKDRLAAADALWEAQQQDSADAIAAITAESKASDEAWEKEKAKLAQEKEAADDLAKSWVASYDAQRAAAFSVTDSISGLLGDLVTDNREASIAIFATRKALAVAEIAVNTAVAASRAVAELGPVAGAPVAAAIVAGGIASGVAVAATAIGEGVSAFGGAQQAQSTTINATLVVEGQPIRNGVRTRSMRVGQR